MINLSFSSNRPREIIKTTIQFVPNLVQGIMNLSCNVQGSYFAVYLPAIYPQIGREEAAGFIANTV